MSGCWEDGICKEMEGGDIVEGWLLVEKRGKGGW